MRQNTRLTALGMFFLGFSHSPAAAYALEGFYNDGGCVGELREGGLRSGIFGIFFCSLTDSYHLDTTVGEGGVDERSEETSKTSGVANANVRLHRGIWL